MGEVPYTFVPAYWNEFLLKILGISKTIQRGDLGEFGQHYMLAPMTNEEVKNQRTCFTLNGTKDSPVQAQHALPDASKFTVSFLT